MSDVNLIRGQFVKTVGRLIDSAKTGIQNPSVRRISHDRPQLTDLVILQIRNAILTCELGPGMRIRQEALAARLGVSRAPIRHAMTVLEREGLLHTVRGRGTYVAPLDAALIRDVYQLRGAVESFVATRLAELPDCRLAHVREIVKAGCRAASLGDLPRLIELDWQFHTGLYDAVGNRILSEVMRGQWVHVRRVMAATLAIVGYPQQVWNEHGAILDAIDAHDPGLAGTLARTHTDAAGKRLLAATPTDERPRTPLNLGPGPRNTSRHTRGGAHRAEARWP